MQDKLIPFVNARIERERDENGYMVPRTAFVDIYEANWLHYDADVRAIRDDGVTLLCFGSERRFIPWTWIERVEIRTEEDLDRQIAQARNEMG